MNTYLVFDIGGSSIKYAIIKEDTMCIEKASVPTPLTSLDDLLESLGKLYDLYKNQIQGIAISMPGILNPENGFVYNGGALSYIKDLNFISVLQKRCPIEITIANDAKCAALAEIGYGALQDVDDAIAIVLGTGIGGCLIHNKEIIMGKHLFAGEFSYIKTNIHEPTLGSEHWCYKNGSIGLLKNVQDALQTNETFTGIQIFDMAKQGNLAVLSALDVFTINLVTQIFNLQVIFDPEKIVIGGGISVQPLLFEYIQKNIDGLIKQMRISVPKPIVVPCKYHNDANLIGALYYHIHKAIPIL